MNQAEQDKSMSLETFKQNITAGKKTGLYPIDLWGLEWWYWQKTSIKMMILENH
jgi:hypothetical protein